ncbi:hypothetical protein [Sporomusa aerivorans]|uniref:hypothetical protein n=1 Tax=Sporomusa aerivorans TaxID=204936 RepID=UPI00352AFB83
MLDVTKVACPLRELQQELAEAMAQIELMKPVVDATLEWMQVKNGSYCYPEDAASLKSRYLYGMCVEMDLYNAAAKYRKAR